MKSSSLTSAVEDLKKELICPICSGIFQDPCTLTPGCGCTFCRECARQLTQGKSNYPHCPTCEIPFDFSRVQISHTLSTIVEKFQSLAQIAEEDCVKMEVGETKDSNDSTMMLHKEEPVNPPSQTKEDLEKELEAVREEIRTIEALIAKREESKIAEDAESGGYRLRSRVKAKRSGSNKLTVS